MKNSKILKLIYNKNNFIKLLIVCILAYIIYLLYNKINKINEGFDIITLTQSFTQPENVTRANIPESIKVNGSYPIFLSPLIPVTSSSAPRIYSKNVCGNSGLNLQQNSWCATSDNNTIDFIQLNLTTPQNVAGIAIQKGFESTMYVTEIYISYVDSSNNIISINSPVNAVSTGINANISNTAISYITFSNEFNISS